LLANDADVDGDIMFPIILLGTSNGTLSVSANGRFVYDPYGGFFGIDSFQYQVTDGTLVSATITVVIRVDGLPNGGGGPPVPIDPPPLDNSGGTGGTDPSNDIIPSGDGGLSNATDNLDDNRRDEKSGRSHDVDRVIKLLPTSLLPTAVESLSSAAQNAFNTRVFGEHRIVDMAMAISPAETLLLKQLLQVDLQQVIVWSQWEKLRVTNEDGTLLGQFAVSTAGTTAGLFSIGYLMWALRGGMFLATVYSSIPAWRMLDPATLLTNYRSSKTTDPTDAVEKLLSK